MRNGRMLVTFMFPSPFLDAFPGSGARRRLAAAFESDALQEAAPHRTGIDRRRIAPPFGSGAGDLADQPAEGDEGPGDGARDAARGLLALFGEALVDLLIDVGAEHGVEFPYLADDRGAFAKAGERIGIVLDSQRLFGHFLAVARSEERRVGQECVSPCRSRWAQ